MKRWLTPPVRLKLVALALAVVVWSVVKALTSDTRTVEGVPLEIKPPAGFQVALYEPKTVSIVVRGSTEDLRQASRYEFFAVLDLQQDLRNGRQIMELQPRHVRHPRRVRVISVTPTNVLVRLTRAAD
jgi:YbbR domain-containing protein